MLEVLKEYDDSYFDIKSKAVKHLQIINDNDEYGTLESIYKMGVSIAGFKPEIDVCASKSNHKCDYYFTLDEDFLDRDDDRFCHNSFANFPYSLKYQCMKKAWELFEKYNGNWLILAYSKTDTKWWHQFVEGKAEVHFIEGRIKFLDSKGNPLLSKYCSKCSKKREFEGIWCPSCKSHTIWKENTSPYPSCFIIYRKKNTSVLSRIINYLTKTFNN